MPTSKNSYQFGEFEIQPDHNTISSDGMPVQISPRVMDVMVYLIENNDRIVSANELLEAFWTDRIVEESTIHRHISQIRAALGDSAREANYIKTVSKRGYQAVAPIKEIAVLESAGVNKPKTAEFDDSHVFISYSHKNKAVVYPEIKWLEEQGVKVWYDNGITPGSNWLEEIGDALLGASTVLYFISEQSLASEHCNREVSLALDEEKNIIPVYLEEVELTSDLKVGLSRVQALRIKEQGFRTQVLQSLAFANANKTPITDVAPAKTGFSLGKLVTAALACIIVVSIILVFFFKPAPLSNAELVEGGEVDETIAVLPFTNMSERESVGFFAQGLSDTILDEFAKTHMKVASRTAAFQYYTDGIELEEMAEKLKVDYVLEGSVQEQAGILLITTQLIRAADGYHVFSKTYQRPYAESFNAQREVSRNISQMSHDKIWLDLRRRNPELHADFKGIKPEAVSLYLRAKEHIYEYALGEGGDINVSHQLMEKAAEVDPTFMLAHSDLAFDYFRRLNPNISAEESSKRAHAAVARMQALTPNSPYTALMLVQIYYMLDLNYAAAEQLIDEQIKRAPDEYWWRAALGEIASREGNSQKALALLEEDSALHQDFTQSEFLPFYADLLLREQRYSQALKYSDLALNLLHHGPPRAHALLTKADILLRLNRDAEAKLLIDEAWYVAEGKIAEEFIHLFARTGDIERANNMIQTAKVSPSNRLYFVLGYESFGDIDSVFELINDGVLDRDRSILAVMRTRFLSEAIRNDPRFQDMLDLLDSLETHTQGYLQGNDRGRKRVL